MLSQGLLVNGIYEIIQPIGEGGAGEVYLAWHKNLKKHIIVKRIKSTVYKRMDVRLEADILKRVKHRHITQVYDYVEVENEVYTVMDFIEGNTMADYINRGIKFDEYQIVQWMKELSSALEYLHSLSPQVLHNDIKPSNIMIDTEGHVCLIDFNISSETAYGSASGGYSRGYASPEQLNRASIQTKGGDYRKIRLDGRSDIYGLGASIYHLMTSESHLSVLNNGRQVFDNPQPYSVTLMGMVDKCIQFNPNDRYQTAGELSKDLSSIKAKDRALKNIRIRQALFTAIFAIMCVFGSFMITKGISIQREESFYKEYHSLITNDFDNSEDTINSCTELLNNQKYNRVYKNNPVTKANLLYLIANSYFEEENYTEAIGFYEKTLEIDNSNPNFYRDYAIAAARFGDINLAESVLQKGKEAGLKDADMLLVEAEVALKSGNNALATEKFAQVIASADNADTLGRSYMLCARAYKEMGQYDSAKELLQSGINAVDDTWRIRLYRELGNLCVAYIQQNGNNAPISYITLAKDCYITLTNSDRAIITDFLNLESLHEMLGEFTDAGILLDSLRTVYPDSYIIPMRQSFLEIIIQSQKANETRNYQAAKSYYEEAQNLYKESKNAGIGDDRMMQLKDLMEELEMQGW